MLDLPALLRLSVSREVLVVSATRTLRPSWRSMVLKRGSEALSCRSIHPPRHEQFILQVDHPQRKQGIEG